MNSGATEPKRRPRGGFKLVKCTNCKRTKKLLKHGEHFTPAMVTLFETDGWLYRSGSKGVCPECNLFNNTEKHHGHV